MSTNQTEAPVAPVCHPARSAGHPGKPLRKAQSPAAVERPAGALTLECRPVEGLKPTAPSTGRLDKLEARSPATRARPGDLSHGSRPGGLSTAAGLRSLLSGAGQAAEAAPQFDWLLGDRQFWTFKALAALIGMSDSFLEKLWDDARHPLHVDGHAYNGGTGARISKRVARAFVVRLLVHSAQYDAGQKRDAVASCFREFSPADLMLLRTQLEAELRKKS